MISLYLTTVAKSGIGPFIQAFNPLNNAKKSIRGAVLANGKHPFKMSSSVCLRGIAAAQKPKAIGSKLLGCDLVRIRYFDSVCDCVV